MDAEALLKAVTSGDLAGVKAMVSADAALVDARSVTGQSAVLTAVYNGHKAIADLLVARGATLTLFEACAAGEVERVELLLADPNTSVNGYGDDGWTPLHLAAFFGHPRVVEMLIAHGADVGARSRNANGNTPLHAALAANRKIVIGLLLGQDADVNAADAAGWRPLHLALASNNVESTKALIAQGADLSLPMPDGSAPLSMVIEKGHRELAVLLQRHGARPQPLG